MLNATDGFLTLIGDAAPVAADAVAYWDIQDVPAGAISVPRLVDENAEQLRDEYVAWSGSLAEIEVLSETLAHVLRSDLLGGGSFWWTTLIAERSPITCPEIYDVLRLRVLEHLFLSGGYRGVCYVGSDRRLHLTLREWMRCLGLGYRWQKTPVGRAGNKRRWFDRLPHLLRAAMFLGHFLVTRLIHHLKIGRAGTPRHGDAELAILTYFPNVDLQAMQEGRFRSRYWGPLHDVIESHGIKVNWILFYAPSGQMSYAGSLKAAENLNRNSIATGQYFTVLEASLSISGLCWAVGEFLRAVAISYRFGAAGKCFRFPGSQLNFFPFLRHAWLGSLRGSEAMRAWLYGSALRDMVNGLPATTRRLMYMWENQGWEQSLLFACKASKRPWTIGVAHSNACTSPLHMRTCLGLDRTGRAPWRPVPDTIVTIGEQPARILREWGWPRHTVTPAEALRYMHLWQERMARRSLPDTGRHLLVVTGFLRAECEFQLQFLSAVIRREECAQYGPITIKAHPDTPVDDLVALFQLGPRVTIKDEPIVSLLAHADVVFAANSTSVAVEAAWMGLPLILTTAIGGLNLSPLNGVADVCFVHSPDTLAAALKNPRCVDVSPDTYLLDTKLPRWEALLVDRCRPDDNVGPNLVPDVPGVIQ